MVKKFRFVFLTRMFNTVLTYNATSKSVESSSYTHITLRI